MNVKYEHVSFAYRTAFALKNVSCEFGSGRTTLIAGHNGSGKSTFLKLMNGILKPTEGSVYLGDMPTRGRQTADLARFCAMSFQNPDDQLFARSVEKELRFGIENTGTDGSLLGPVEELLHLRDHLESNPYSLTYAQRRLLAIASSAAMDTPVLTLDEPTAGLSVREKKFLADLIAFLKEKSKTMAIVTHDLNFLLPFADDILILRHGELQFTGRRDELFSEKVGRELMKRSGVTYPVYPRISSALGLGKDMFDPEEIVGSIEKKRAGATRRTNGQHQLEGA